MSEATERLANEVAETMPQAIAVIGMACRFPGASSVEQFWQNLRSGTESITFFSADELRAAGVDEQQLGDPRFVAARGVLEEADSFDAGFFGFGPREAALIDPQQRVFLETAWSALEDAGYDSRQYAGPIGMFAGSILSTYLLRNLWPNAELMSGAGNFQIAVGNDPIFLATRTSYQLDLRGPSISVGTACSTSLVAVHLACQSLLAYESDMALAGGVSVHMPLIGSYRYEEGGVLSPDGHCRPFDANAQGTVSSDGAGVVVLKRLAEAIRDGDTIQAVIRGSAINNDGREKVGYTAPSGAGEAKVIAEAMAMAGVEPESISLLEAHGAGTLLGDPIEVSALMEAFGDCGGQRSFCALGSVKSNIGHVDAAAGIAGLIKAVLALRHRQIPPTLHFETPNPQLDLARSPFYVNDELRDLTSVEGPVRAGVSSFGIGGTNVHVVLEEAPVAMRADAPQPRPDLLVLSARSAEALEAATDRLADHLEAHSEQSLGDIAFTLLQGRRAFGHRRIVVADTTAEAAAALHGRDPQRTASAVVGRRDGVPVGGTPALRSPAGALRPAVTFMFPGLGDHYPAMGWEIYCTEPVYRETVDRCAVLLRGELQLDIRDFLFAGRDWAHPVLERKAAGKQSIDLRAMLGRSRPAAGGEAPKSDQPAAAQPAIFVTELALATLLRSWGIEPEAMIGHSIGEFTAACVAGVLSMEDALHLVATRARLIESQVAPGAMLAVPMSEAELLPLLPAGTSLGAINAERLCIASGEESAITDLAAVLTATGVSCQRLRSTHAYHSKMMETTVNELTNALRRVMLRAPKIPYVSCITGTWITDAEATDPAYWAQHICRTVRFQRGLSTLLDDPRHLLLEVGPGQGLTSHAIAERSRVAGREQTVIPTMRWSYGLQSELSVLLRGAGQLWMAGAPLDTTRFQPRGERRRVSLPTYPFERQRYWVDPPTATANASIDVTARKRTDVADWFYLPSWKPSVLTRRGEVDASGKWLLFLDRLGLGAALAKALREQGATVFTVETGAGFERDGDRFVIEPAQADDYQSLLRELTADDSAPRTIVHLWSLTPEENIAPSATRFEQLQELGYHSVMRLLQALSREGLDGSTRIELVTNELQDVTGNESLAPEKATLRAPVMVAPQEHAGLICRCIDVEIPPPRDAAVTLLLDELLSNAAEPFVAYRRGRRWLPAYEQVRIEASPRTPFRKHGVYLLTGGLGNVGMILARQLAERAQARLAFVGRSAFPSREEWSRWLAGHDTNDDTSIRIAQLQELERLGAEVLVLRADVANEDEMRAALATIEQRFGALHGVIHGAGAVGLDTFREIRQATTADSESQFVAKVRGLLVLDAVLGARPLDFCLLMSSLSAILGGLGFSAYSAANSFMDAFARMKNRGAGTRWTSVDWDSWRAATSRPAATGFGATVSEFVMEPEEGFAAFERILAEGNLGQVVVSTGDLAARLRTWIERRGQLSAAPATAIKHARPSLNTTYEAPRGEMERELAEIWQELFGVATVGVHDNFFELGGHSLLATQLNARLAARLHVDMSLAALLQAPTIAELAIAVLSRQAEQADPDALERMLAELIDLDEMDGAELQNMAGGSDE